MADLIKARIDMWTADVQRLTPGDGITFDGGAVNAVMNPSNTYNKTEVNELIWALETVSLRLVDALPTTGEANVIYLVPNGSSTNIRDEYVWIDGEWEPIGSTAVDMSNYMRKDAMLDFVWPVGSYYETSETSFDPNVEWGGTWVLEDGGNVHVSSGNGYASGATGGAETKPYTPHGTNQAVTLTAAQSGNQAQTVTSGGMSANASHSHQPAANDSYTPANLRYVVTNSGSDLYMSENKLALPSQDSGTNGRYFMIARTSRPAVGEIATTNTSSVAHTHSVAVAAKDATASHNHTFTGTAANINVMQPYIAVNRWHRTA